MTERFQRHSPAWVTFSYVSFGLSCLMMAGGLFYAPIDLATKGYMAMAAVMLVQTTVSVAKTLRDNHEAESLMHRLEDAKAEKLLLDVTESAGA